MHGQGKYWGDDESLYQGEFQNGFACGIVKLTKSNGDIYDG